MIKKIKAWSTSKKALVIAVATGMLYGICVFIANLKEHQIDSTLTQEFYSFVRSLDALKISMQGNNKTVILSPDSPIAQIFYGK